MLKRRNTGGCKQPGRLSFRSGGLVPGRALGAVLDEAHEEGGRRSDGCIRAIKGRNSEIGRWRCNRAEAERRASAAGAVRLILNIWDRRLGTGG